jgi:transcriptional regulator with XRE-family HTH domain
MSNIEATFMANYDTPESNTDKPSSESLHSRLSGNIATRRRQLELTQAQLAEQLGVDTETLSRFERGKHLPSLTTLEKLAGILQTTVAELLAETPVFPEEDALAISVWLYRLNPKDRTFVKGMIKQFCEYFVDR